MSDAIKFHRFGLMLDCSRNAVMNLPTLKKWIDLTADMGYNTLLLYTEDTYEVDNQPYFGHLRGRYSQKELKEIDDYAFQKGMEVIPCIQTLAHLNAIFRWPQYQKIRDCDDILMAGEEDVYALIEDMFATLAKCFRSRVVNIGMDEAHMLGRGQYQTKNGMRDRSEILVEHLSKVAEIAARHGFEITMWGDMFFRLASGGNYYVDELHVSDELKAKIPSNANLIYWDYYSADKKRYDTQIRLHSAIKDNIWFAGGLWSWTGFAPHNVYSIECTTAALSSCLENNVQNVFLTMWGDNGAECSKFSCLPSLYYSAEYAKGNTDMAAIKKGFEEKYGIPFDSFMLLDLLGTPNENKEEPLNPDKYMMYNDCFMGIFDSTVRDGDAESYAACAKKLAAFTDDPTWGYLYRTMETLCDVLAVKFNIGVKTRKAYLAGDKKALAALVEDYGDLLKRIDAFYDAFRSQWEKENKPHGFDVQDVRLGGLYRRVWHCKNRLQQYLDGVINRIEELEEPVLDSQGKGAVEATGPVSYNDWKTTVSANVI